MNQMSIPEFYKDKSVFITGATGFIGKMLVEKLLWSCPEIENIFILVRSKKGKAVQERVEEITNSPVFGRIWTNHPDYLKKIIALEGDMTMENLGMSNEDLARFNDKINVIFHSAASIKMNEPIKLAISNNTIPTKRLIHMAKSVKNLAAFVHVSTAFSNFYNENVYEVPYLPPYDPNDIIKMTQSMPEGVQKQIEPILLDSMQGTRPFPNTYTYSKYFAEAFVTIEGEGIPRAIVRPSLVMSAIHEPTRGWIENWGVPTIVASISTGVLHHVDASDPFIFDVVPADMTVNCTIAAGWKVGVEKPNEVQIYNASTGTSNPILTRELFDYIEDFARKIPFDRVMWWPTAKFTTDRITKRLYPFLYHTIPANLIDLSRKLRGKKPFMRKIYSQLVEFYKVVGFSANSPYFYHNENAQKLAQSLSKSDQIDFPFDMKTIDWKECGENYAYGVKKYLLKEDCSEKAIIKNQQKMQRLKLYHFGLKYFIIGALLLLVGTIFLKIFGVSKLTVLEQLGSN